LIEVSIAVVLVAFYLAFKRHEPFDWQVVAAAAVMAVYLVIYLIVPPQLGITSPQTGKLFGLVPALSFAAILFPDLAVRVPAQVIRLLGWIGLLGVFVILCAFKIFIW